MGGMEKRAVEEGEESRIGDSDADRAGWRASDWRHRLSEGLTKDPDYVIMISVTLITLILILYGVCQPHPRARFP